MDRVRVGLVGSGGMAEHHLGRFAGMPGVAVVALASRNVETGAALAGRYDADFLPEWQGLMAREEIDGVVICTHNDSHGEIALAALAADKHVFVEYPIASDVGEAEAVLRLAEARGRVLRVSHPEAVSNTHRALKARVRELGDLLLTSFVRLTPGRGARPEVLFNLAVSGSPAHFFIYHIYPIVDLFGGGAVVNRSAVYEGLRENGRYDRFVNTLTVEFARGGIGQWTWAGGIAINASEEHERYVLRDGTLSDAGGEWCCTTPAGVMPLVVPDVVAVTLQELWVSEIRGAVEGPPDLGDAGVAVEAVRISVG